MAAFGYTYNQTSNCCKTTAAACSSARISLILDTALLLAVSIFIGLIPVL